MPDGQSVPDTSSASMGAQLVARGTKRYRVTCRLCIEVGRAALVVERLFGAGFQGVGWRMARGGVSSSLGVAAHTSPYEHVWKIRLLSEQGLGRLIFILAKSMGGLSPLAAAPRCSMHFRQPVTAKDAQVGRP